MCSRITPKGNRPLGPPRTIIRNIFTMGMKPASAGFHTPFPESIYVQFHTWGVLVFDIV